MLRVLWLSWSLSEDQKRMTLRYLLSVFLGTLGILFLQSYFQSNYDSVASVALFGCIIAVTGEDQSLGPVISKSLFRILGVSIGGIFGYLFLYLPTHLFQSSKVECLLIIPAIFCAWIQWLTKGGMPSLTKLIKAKKATHLLIQIQVAFGIVYVGSWDALDRGLLVALCRTCAILYGCLALLVASLISYPKTSMNVCCVEIATCFRSVGQLFLAICNDRVEGVGLGPYDHRGKVLATLTSPDDHMKIIEAIDAKLTRGIFLLLTAPPVLSLILSIVSSLLPFLYLEPAWVPGLPTQLIGTESRLSSNWGLLIGVLHSRLTRIRSTLITMDSNSRLTRDMKLKKINQEICEEMKKITEHFNHSCQLIATYLESPYLTTCGWKGNLNLRKDFVAEVVILKRDIEIFSILITKKIIEILDEKRSFYDVNQEEGEGIWFESEVPTQSEEGTRDGVSDESHPTRQRKRITESSRTRIPYRDRSCLVMRDRVGMTLDYYHRLYPNKTFCNLAIQVCLQTISCHKEVIDFIDSIVFTEGEGGGVGDEEEESWSHRDGYRSVGTKEREGQVGGVQHKSDEQQQLHEIELPPAAIASHSSVMDVVENPLQLSSV